MPRPPQPVVCVTMSEHNASLVVSSRVFPHDYCDLLKSVTPASGWCVVLTGCRVSRASVAIEHQTCIVHRFRTKQFCRHDVVGDIRIRAAKHRLQIA